MTTTFHDKGVIMSANNPLPKRLEQMIKQPQLPLDDEMFALLRQWFPYAPVLIRGSADRREFDFLKWLLKGRVVEVLLKLEASPLSIDHRIASLLRDYGRKTCPHGPYPAQPMSQQLFGWIGIEMGNPPWHRHPRTAFIELPTVRMLETYARMLGGRLEQREFFPGGVYIVENLTDEQKDAVSAIAREHDLKGHWLFGGGSIVFSANRPTPRPKPPVGVRAEELERMRKETEALLIEMMIAAGADMSEKPLDVEIQQTILDQIAQEERAVK
ncbi:MAG: hypothetical protein FIB02_06415 [Desulfuromonas sp.]|nr:hypothetical protein [Desulfuromonas sp.]